MATPLLNEDFRIEVRTSLEGATPEVFAPIGDMNSYTHSDSGDSTSTYVFHTDEAYVTEGPDDYTYTVSGLYNPADPGQLALITARRNKTPVVIRVLPAGADEAGYRQKAKVTGLTHDAARDDAFQPVSFDLTGYGAKTDVEAV